MGGERLVQERGSGDQVVQKLKVEIRHVLAFLGSFLHLLCTG